MSIKIHMDLSGNAALLRSLDALGKAAPRAIAGSMRKALRPTMNLIRANAPRDTDALQMKQAMAIKVKTYRKTGAVVGMVGWRSEYVLKGADEYRNDRKPVRYAHIMEFGSRHVAPRPFIRPAWMSTKRTAERLLVLGLKDEIKRVAKAERKKSRKKMKAKAYKFLLMK